MSNVVKKALPGSIVMVLAVFAFFVMRNIETIQPGSLRVNEYAAITMSVLTMIFISFVVLFRTSLPLDWYRGTLFFVLLVGAIVVMFAAGYLRVDLFKIDYRDLSGINIIELVVINIGAVVAFFLIDLQFADKKKKKR